MFIVKYSGPFGYIKPWTAVRDSETFSQQFLTPSIIEGIEKKLFPELLEDKGIHKIKRHRLSYRGIDVQQEKTWSKGIIDRRNPYRKNISIINRGVMLDPILYLAFDNIDDASIAASQTLCLCRNEDLLYPIYIKEMNESEFNDINGFELMPTDSKSGFIVGYNRFNKAEKMYGKLEVFGEPIRYEYDEYE